VVVAADFNHDGKLDLAVANACSNRVGSLLGDGAGGFTLRSTAPTGSMPFDMVTNDFNGDRLPDLFVYNSVGPSVSVLLDIADPPVPGPSSLGTPAPGSDLTATFTFGRRKPRRNPRTGRYRQVLTVRYTGTQVLQGPLTLALERLNSKVTLRKAAGAAMGKTAQGVPTVVVTPAGGQLSPGQLLTVALEFSASSAKRIRYIPRVFAG
jgi:hypothetical protein